MPKSSLKKQTVFRKPVAKLNKKQKVLKRPVKSAVRKQKVFKRPVKAKLKKQTVLRKQTVSGGSRYKGVNVTKMMKD